MLKNITWVKYPIIHVPFMRVSGIALFPFILVREKAFINNSEIIRHEHIHLKQQLELLILPFYVIYLINYIINLVKFKNHYKAYLNIVFEKEAYANDNDALYLQNRTIWSFKKYISTKKIK